MICALCRNERPLRNSHIYPEWIFKPLYDSKHRMEMLSVDPEVGNTLLQKGMRERLLCDACEQKLSVWEGYASSVLVPPPEMLAGKQADGWLQIENIDYEKLKLFELSILWRAGVSKLQFFRNCQLGPHAERLRCMLDASQPGSQDSYGAATFCLKIGDRPETLQAIAEPQPVRTSGIRGYNLTFGGFVWLFFVSSTLPPEALRLAFLRSSGTRLVCVKDALEMRNFQDFASELLRMGRPPKGWKGQP